ncbi:hypothetical protein VF12_40805, partial [Nostoc linckia z15]
VDQESFGNLEFARYYCYFFTIVVNYGFDVTITRTITLKKNNKPFLDELISQVYYAKLLLLAGAAALYFIIILLVPSLYAIAKLLSATFLINIGFVLFPLWYYQGVERLSRISLINFFVKVGIAALTVILVKKNSDYWIFNGLQSLALIVVGIISLLMLRYFYGFRVKRFRRRIFYSIIKGGYPIFLSTLLITINGSSYFLFLKLFSTEAELGSFSAANKLISSILSLMILPFSQAYFPMIIRLSKENFLLFKKSMAMAARILFGITLFTASFLILFNEEIISIIFGDAYTSSSIPLMIMSATPMLMLLSNLFASQGLLSLRKDREFLRIQYLGILVMFAGSIIIIDHVSAVSVAWVRFASESTVLVVSLLYYSRVVKQRSHV